MCTDVLVCILILSLANQWYELMEDSFFRRNVGQSVAYSLNCSCCPLICLVFCLLHAPCSRPMLIHSVACSLAFKRLGKRIMSGVWKHLFQKMTRSWVEGHNFGCNKFYWQLCSLTCSLIYLLAHQLGLMIKSLPKYLSSCIPCMPYYEKRRNWLKGFKMAKQWPLSLVCARSARPVARRIENLTFICIIIPIFKQKSWFHWHTRYMHVASYVLTKTP